MSPKGKPALSILIGTGKPRAGGSEPPESKEDVSGSESSELGDKLLQAIKDESGAAILDAVRAICQQEMGSDYDEKDEA